MRRFLAVAALMCALAIPTVAADKDNTCVPCAKSTHFQLENNRTPQAVTTSDQAQEWQCIVVDIVIECAQYDYVPCSNCYDPCIAGCGIACEAGTCWKWRGLCKYAAGPCAIVCDTLCRASCPKCRECVRYKATKVYSCGWVWTE